MPYTSVADQRAYDQQRKVTLMAAGLCVICAGLPSKGVTPCLPCRRRRSARRARVRDARIARGICVTCPHAAMPGKRRCRECQVRDSVNNAKRYAKVKAERAAEIRRDMTRMVASGRPVSVDA
jgi:hypothetical protein